uniref:Uncharacterized protein n=1 Tax=Tanacetum cinerariifolium TaxID=118510 RepID=A0A6L2KAI0_TANCI|nr:hypothetical protein [Tanacetum cinerariifolium]
MAIETEKNSASGSMVIEENMDHEDMADMALCKRSLASGGDNTNHGLKIYVTKPSPFVGKRESRVVDDFLWEVEQYLERISRSNSIRRMLRTRRRVNFVNSSNPRRYERWAKTKLERQGVQYLSTSIAHAEALIDFSMRRESSNPKDLKVNKNKGKGLQYVEENINGVKVRALVDYGVTHNFVVVDEAERLGITAMKGSGTIKEVNSLAKPI